jgi:hypothetical protein
MNNPDPKNTGNQSNLPAAVSQSGNLLDTALANLPPEQRKALSQKALERKLDIDAMAVEADNRHRASSMDMANTLHQIRALESTTKSDYTVKAEYETASGRTNVEIKKSNNTVIIVIAIVIAIIVLVMFSN